MFDLRVRDLKSTFFDRRAVMSAVDRGTRKVLSRFGAFVRTRARTSIRPRPRTSLPGETPTTHTGLLKRFILFAYEPDRRSVVIGPARLSGPSGSSVPSTLEFGGPGTNARGRPIQIAPRPYMRPAFEAEKSRLPPLWRDAIH